LATLAELGEERIAGVGDVLFRVGDQSYPLIAILEGEVAILDAAGNEIVRHGESKFLGEMNLLTGQTVFLTAIVTEPLRYIAVERDALRPLLFDDGPLSDLLLSTFMARREALQQVEGIGLEIAGPHSSEATMRMVDFARANRLPFTWNQSAPPGEAAPVVRLPGGTEMHAPSTGEVMRALGIGLELGPREEVDLLVVGGGPAGLGAAVYGASEGLETLVVESTALGGQAGSSRRIENYLGFPAGISGAELTSRAVTQARKFNARTATPYRVISLEAGNGHHIVRLEEAPSTAGCRSRDSPSTRDSACSTRPDLPRPNSAALPASGWSAAAIRRARRPCGLRGAVRSSRCSIGAQTCATRCPPISSKSSSAMASQSATRARSARCTVTTDLSRRSRSSPVSVSRSRFSSSSSGRGLVPSGSTMPSPATRTASS
jgi:hypothetical protein